MRAHHPAVILASAVGVTPCASKGSTTLGVLLLDQIGDSSTYNLNAGVGPTPSQIFTDFPEYSCVVLENFTVTSGQLTVTNVSALFRAQGGYTGFQQVGGYALRFYNSPSQAGTGIDNSIASLLVVAGSGATVTRVLDGGGSHEYGLVSLDVNVVLPAVGNYWFGVSPVSASSVSGQFLLQNSGAASGTPGDGTASFINPDNGFGMGPASSLSSNFAYSISVVPEPTAALFSMVAGAGQLFRRRRHQPSGGIL